MFKVKCSVITVLSLLLTEVVLAEDIDLPMAMVVYSTDSRDPEKSALVAYFDDLRVVKRSTQDFGIVQLSSKHSRVTSVVANYDPADGIGIDYARLLEVMRNNAALDALTSVKGLKSREAIQDMAANYMPANKWVELDEDALNAYNFCLRTGDAAKPQDTKGQEENQQKPAGEVVEEGGSKGDGTTPVSVPGQLVFEDEAVVAAPDASEEIVANVGSIYGIKNSETIQSFGKVYHVVTGTQNQVDELVSRLNDKSKIFGQFWQSKQVAIEAFQNELGEPDQMIDRVEGAYLVNLKGQKDSYLVFPCFERTGVAGCRDVVIPAYKTEISDDGSWDIFITDDRLFSKIFKPMITNLNRNDRDYEAWPLEYDESEGSIGFVKMAAPKDADEKAPDYGVHLKFATNASNKSIVRLKVAQDGRWLYRVEFSEMAP